MAFHFDNPYVGNNSCTTDYSPKLGYIVNKNDCSGNDVDMEFYIINNFVGQWNIIKIYFFFCNRLLSSNSCLQYPIYLQLDDQEEGLDKQDITCGSKPTKIKRYG